MKARGPPQSLHKMTETTCVVCGEGSEPICYECKAEDFYRFHRCSRCAAHCADNDCGGYYLCDICIIEVDEFWSDDEDSSDDESSDEEDN